MVLARNKFVNEDGTTVWPRVAKKSRKRVLISGDSTMAIKPEKYRYFNINAVAADRYTFNAIAYGM